MREIIFDTETTGLDAREDRIIELGGVELVNRFPTGRTFHKFINPQGRAINPEAEAVHGISAAQLVGQPNFAEICAEFLEFVEDAKLVAHNAGFDMGFINAEFGVDETHVEAGIVRDQLGVLDEFQELGADFGEVRLPDQLGGADAVHRLGFGIDGAALRVDEFMEGAAGREPVDQLDAAKLDDAILAGVEAGGFCIEDDLAHHRRSAAHIISPGRDAGAFRLTRKWSPPGRPARSAGVIAAIFPR